MEDLERALRAQTGGINPVLFLSNLFEIVRTEVWT
jgi:hypothetical protein